MQKCVEISCEATAIGDGELWKTQKCVEMSCGVTAIGDGELWLTPCKLVRYEVTCERSLENGKNKRVSVGDGRSW